MTARQRTVIVIVVTVVVVIVLLVRGGKKQSAPQPAAWSTPASNAESSGVAPTSGVVSLPSNPSYIIWDYNQEKSSFAGYLPEKNELAQLSLTGDAKTITTLGDMSILNLSISADGKHYLVYVLHDSGNKQYAYLNLTENNPQLKTLPYTVSAANWLPDGSIVYIFNDTNNLTLSRATDTSLANWQMITALSEDFRDSTVSVSEDGTFALVIARSTGAALVVDIPKQSIHPVTGTAKAALWVRDSHTVLLQGLDSTTNSILVVNADTLDTHSIANVKIPLIALQQDALVIGISPNYQTDEANNIDTLVINLSTGASKTGTFGIAGVDAPTLFFADKKRSQLIAGTDKKITSLAYKEVFSRVAKP